MSPGPKSLLRDGQVVGWMRFYKSSHINQNLSVKTCGTQVESHYAKELTGEFSAVSSGHGRNLGAILED